MQCWVGTSGYSYSDWVGGFYPQGTKGRGMLIHYCRHFPLVELNFSFYRNPTPEILARMADQTPDGFQFIVKVPRTISHEERNEELPLFRSAIEELRRRQKLSGVLLQLPQSAHFNQERLNRLGDLTRAFEGCGMGVEFRHISWHEPEIRSWLASQKIDLVSVDVPRLPSLYPRGLERSTQRIYVRFHSRNGGNWYVSDKDRYDYDYGEQELKEWIDAIRSQEGKAEQVFLLFNNCHRGHSAENARRMQELLREMAPELEVASPKLQIEQQKTLF
jgi:uncharacterized protein YecE (DUF72 family)